jgi:glycosyltransferase involved in cell wall biosynthesis
MEDNLPQEPLVSITLPLASDASPGLLDICIRSISNQVYRNFECLIFISENSSPEIYKVIDKYPFVHVLEGKSSKSGARNLLVKNCKGRFLLYLDVDMELSPDVVKECVEKTLSDDSKAIVIPSLEAPRPSFWVRCRSLERKLLLSDPADDSPLFLEVDTFWRVRGFDEQIDLLDDWVLTLRLLETGIRFDRIDAPIYIRETTNLKTMFRRKYRRGKLLPALLREFPNAPPLKFRRRFFNSYLKNWRLLLDSPVATLGLFFLKTLDILALSLGRINPVSEIRENGSSIYFKPDIASTYDEIRLGDSFNLYKHTAEVMSLLSLLPTPSIFLLEVGCGTGRITSELTSKGFHIVPTDPSLPMLQEFQKKPKLPNPINTDGKLLPFRNDQFEGTYSLRVIWHLSTFQAISQILSEAARVSSQFIILDITNAYRWNHPIIKLISSLYFRLNPKEYTAHKTSRLLTLQEFSQLCSEYMLDIDKILPLDVISPLWLKILPKRITKPLFSSIYRLELWLARFVPPGRYLIKISKSST